MSSLAPSIAMFAAIALTVFGARFVHNGEYRTKGVLMLVMAAVLVANVLIWTL